MNWLDVNLSVWSAAVAALIGYFLADVVSGFVHWATDTWSQEGVFSRRWFAIAREHHTHPEHILAYDFYERAMAGSAPSTFFIGPIAALTGLLPPTSLVAASMCIYLVISVCGLFGTSLHNLGHRYPSSGLIRLAQRWHLVLSVEHHRKHHRGNHTTRYCVVNGWANYLFDGLRIWRGLERLIHRLSGAIPRSDNIT